MIVANTIKGTTGQLLARGGVGVDFTANGGAGGGGGGGVIWIAARSKLNSFDCDVSGGAGPGVSGTAGNVALYKINDDNSLTYKGSDCTATW